MAVRYDCFCQKWSCGSFLTIFGQMAVAGRFPSADIANDTCSKHVQALCRASTAPKIPTVSPLGSGMPLVGQELLNAFTEFDRSLSRSWSGVMADQSLHSHGVQHQDDFERRRGGGGLYLGFASRGIVDPDQHLSYSRVIDIC
jgi:hypothetical protein